VARSSVLLLGRKSSILIAAACTATVTEIAYHNKPIIEADISFLSEEEWREELTVLLDDLIEEDGDLKHTTNLNGDAGVARSKVRRPCFSPARCRG
jgi:hypothetical protein